MNDDKLVYQIALTQINGIGRILGRNLVLSLGDVEAVFKEKSQNLHKLQGIGSFLVKEIKNPELFRVAEKEINFIRKNNIQVYFFTDDAYPYRLKECVDMPLLLYYKGNADLNSSKMISMVGTRNATSYGIDFCANFISDLSKKYPETVVVSGLAYGIDIQSHRAALKSGLATVGVMAHGLDRVYPYTHRQTAFEMVEQGGLLTEYISGTNPEKYNFVTRNSIIAGLSDATIVVESASKGGSLITADIANAYNRDVFAVPGRITDKSFKGCLNLIKQNKATLLDSLDVLEANLGWDRQKTQKNIQQTFQFEEDLTNEEKLVVDAIHDRIHINQLAIKTNIAIHQLAFLLLELEFKNIIKPLPGGMYARK